MLPFLSPDFNISSSLNKPLTYISSLLLVLYTLQAQRMIPESNERRIKAFLICRSTQKPFYFLISQWPFDRSRSQLVSHSVSVGRGWKEDSQNESEQQKEWCCCQFVNLLPQKRLWGQKTVFPPHTHTVLNCCCRSCGFLRRDIYRRDIVFLQVLLQNSCDCLPVNQSCSDEFTHTNKKYIFV